MHGASTSPEADRLWQSVLEQAAGPGSQFTTQAEAVKAVRGHLDKQEATLRAFLHAYPADPRHYSATIRLSGVLAAKARLLKQPDLRTEGHKLLASLLDDAATPEPVKADASFALISQGMEDAAGQPTDSARNAIYDAIHSFDESYPGDRRTAGMLTEIATLYDRDPTRKATLLDEADKRTTDATLRARISDDRRRLALLGKPLDLELPPVTGGPPVRLTTLRGHVVVVLFWASWSVPSLRELASLEQVAGGFAGQRIDFFTVSLDKDRRALAATCEEANLRWPVTCDGRGWEGAMVRSLGINALPTVWVLDRKGVLLNLNAHGNEVADLIRSALATE